MFMFYISFIFLHLKHDQPVGTKTDNANANGSSSSKRNDRPDTTRRTGGGDRPAAISKSSNRKSTRTDRRR